MLQSFSTSIQSYHFGKNYMKGKVYLNLIGLLRKIINNRSKWLKNKTYLILKYLECQ